MTSHAQGPDKGRLCDKSDKRNNSDTDKADIPDY